MTENAITQTRQSIQQSQAEMTYLHAMHLSPSDSVELIGTKVPGLRLGLLILAIVYCVHKYLQRRQNHAVILSPIPLFCHLTSLIA